MSNSAWKNKASYKKINTSSKEKVLAFEREKEGKKVIFIGNFSKESQEFTIETAGEFKNLYSNVNFSIIKDKKLQLKPWDFVILQ